MLRARIAKFSDEVDLQLFAEALRTEKLEADNGTIGAKGFVKVEEKKNSGRTYAVEGVFRWRTERSMNDINLLTGEPRRKTYTAISFPFANFVMYENGLVFITVSKLDWKAVLSKIRDLYNVKLKGNGRALVQIGTDYKVTEKLLRKLVYSKDVKKVLRITIDHIGEIPPNPIPFFDEDHPYVKATKEMGKEIDKIVLHAKRKAEQIKNKLVTRALVSYSGVHSIKVVLNDGAKITADYRGVVSIDKKRGEPESLFRLAEAFESVKDEFTEHKEEMEIIDKEYSF